MRGRYTDSIKDEERNLQEALESREKQEEILWKSKSRNLWLKEGERNSSFFHKATIQHRQANIIVCLKTNNGTIVEKHEDIENTLMNHF